jgi:steroid 5-alpha reductase family enzyme
MTETGSDPFQPSLRREQARRGETQALRSKGEAYRDYQRRVIKFMPLPPKAS